MSEQQDFGGWGRAATDTQQRLMRVHEAFQSQLHDAWPSAESERAVSEAYANYLAAVQEPWNSPELNQRVAAEYAECQKRVRDAFAGSSGDRVREGFRRYVGELQRAWTTLDPKAVTPEELGALAQSMAWVAGVAYAASAARSGASDSGSRQ